MINVAIELVMTHTLSLSQTQPERNHSVVESNQLVNVFFLKYSPIEVQLGSSAPVAL